MSGKTWYLIILMIMMLTAENCRNQKEEIVDLKDVKGILWLNSYEEDSADVKAYRPETYNLPPARGRSGFKIENDSIFTLYGIAPTDGWEKHRGSWKFQGNQLEVIFDKKDQQPLYWEIIRAQKDFILIKRNENNKTKN